MHVCLSPRSLLRAIASYLALPDTSGYWLSDCRICLQLRGGVTPSVRGAPSQSRVAPSSSAMEQGLAPSGADGHPAGCEPASRLVLDSARGPHRAAAPPPSAGAPGHSPLGARAGLAGRARAALRPFARAGLRESVGKVERGRRPCTAPAGRLVSAIRAGPRGQCALFLGPPRLGPAARRPCGGVARPPIPLGQQRGSPGDRAAAAAARPFNFADGAWMRTCPSIVAAVASARPR